MGNKSKRGSRPVAAAVAIATNDAVVISTGPQQASAMSAGAEQETTLKTDDLLSGYP